MQDKISGGPQNHHARIERTDCLALLVQPPRQQYRSSNFVELQARPVGRPIDPAILRETAVRPLKGGEPDQRAERRAGLAGGEKCGRALHQVSGPNEVITTAVVIALGFSPGDAQGGDQRALKNLVFMGQQHATAKPVHSAAIGGIIAEVELGIYNSALPLAHIPFTMRLKRLGQRLKQLRRCARIAAATGHGDREFTDVGQIDFSGQRNVALFRFAKLPVHFEIAR